MSTKRKIKIKKKNFSIFISIILILIISITLIITKTTNNKTTTKTIPKNDITAYKDKIDYYNNNYKERYIKYEKKHKNLTKEQVIKNVNMNLDLQFYKDTFKTKNLNTTIILVNKYYYVDKNYVPNNLENIDIKYSLKGMKLTKVAREAFEELAKDAKKENLNIIAMSTYRSYEYQEKIYNDYVKKDGKEAADKYSGRPGHSEHQTGLAIDVYNEKESYTNFEKTDEFKWMQEHAHEYGFILRFPKEKENETGYIYESWHYRYVGKKAAKYIKEHNISLEEYYATKIKDW